MKYIINGILTDRFYDIYVVKHKRTGAIMKIKSHKFNKAEHTLLKEIKTPEGNVFLPDGTRFCSGPTVIEMPKPEVLEEVVKEAEAAENSEEAKLEESKDEVREHFPMSDDKIRKTSRAELNEMAVKVGLPKKAVESLESKKLVVEKIAEVL